MLIRQHSTNQKDTYLEVPLGLLDLMILYPLADHEAPSGPVDLTVQPDLEQHSTLCTVFLKKTLTSS